MKKELQYRDFASKLAQYPGKYFLRYEQEQINYLLSKITGYFLVQLGVLDNYDLRSASKVMQRVYVGHAPVAESQLSFIESNFSELPFQPESVDAFLLPHTLEYVESPDKLLNELYHSLIPGGKLIILGYNPYSFIGLTQYRHLYSLGHVKFWLEAIGFSISYQKRICYRPPLKNKTTLKRLFFMEPLGQLCFPFLGNVYVLMAEKKILPVTPIKIKKTPQRVRVARGFPEPSTRKSLYES